jgi:hypothetical protein
MDCDQTVMGLPFVKTAVFLVKCGCHGGLCEMSDIPSGINRVVCMCDDRVIAMRVY